MDWINLVLLGHPLELWYHDCERNETNITSLTETFLLCGHWTEETECSHAVCQYLMHEVLQLIQLWNKNKLRVKSTYERINLRRDKECGPFQIILAEYCNYNIKTIRQLPHTSGRFYKKNTSLNVWAHNPTKNSENSLYFSKTLP